MSDFLLTQIINYGAPILGLIVFIGALGVPFPGTFLVVAVGAFCRQGLLSWHITGLVAYACVVLGDCLSYSMGYYLRGLVLHRFSASQQWAQAEKSFQRWGGMSVFLTRFLVTGIAVPVNLLAGTGSFPFKRFLVYDVLGEAIWIFGYGGLGYLFGTQWEVVSDFISNFGVFALGLVILGVGIWLGIKRLRAINAAKSKSQPQETQ
ncbi:MAG TPA: DedA family protein [Anaerolineales bacterium]|nr:DedA family protein [Anaerolineales bacterium]